ncbi:MAG: hypothetical protein HY043_21870, partial [Verrucomicrobia bacterium]|nr:hypothetical protein [Verrucomicrobiota bacterium]
KTANTVGTCSAVVTVTVTDGCGNAASVTYNTRIDNTPPVPVAGTIAACYPTVAAAETAAIAATGATDNCPGALVKTANTVGTCSAVVTVTVTDGCGNAASVTYNTRIDNTPPVPVCQNITVNLSSGAPGSVTVNASQVNNGSSDNCTAPGSLTLQIKKTSGGVFGPSVSFGCSETGPRSVVLNVIDACGNSATCNATVTVVDNTPPTAMCKPPFAATLSAAGTVAINVAAIENGSTDNCGVAMLEIKKTLASDSTYGSSVIFGCAELDAQSVTLRVTDPSGNTSTCSTMVTVNQRATTLTYQGPTQAYYADCVPVKAQLKDNLSGLGVAGKTVTFTIGAATASATTDVNGVAATTLTLSTANLPSPPAYAVATSFAGLCPFLASSDSDPFTIVPALAGPLAGKACYTGNLFFWTTGPSSSTATLALSATIRDVTAVCASDIRNAKVSFMIRNGSTLTPITGAQNLPVGLVDPTDKKVGTANALVQFNIGSASATTYEIAVIVTGAYQFNNPADDKLLTVAKPIPGGMIVGGGEVSNDNGSGGNDSSGYLAGDLSPNTQFGFDVEYTKSLTNPQGKLWFFFFSHRQPDGRLDTIQHKYKFTSTAIAVLATTPASGTASFSSKANLVDVTNPASPISIDGGVQLQVDLFDHGTSSSGSDTIGVTLYRKGGGVWFALKWNGVKTVQKAIAAGDLSVK